MSTEDRIADPGFTAAMDQKDAAVAELLAHGVPYATAMKVVNRVYDAGRERGLYLGLRGAIPSQKS